MPLAQPVPAATWPPVSSSSPALSAGRPHTNATCLSTAPATQSTAPQTFTKSTAHPAKSTRAFVSKAHAELTQTNVSQHFELLMMNVFFIRELLVFQASCCGALLASSQNTNATNKTKRVPGTGIAVTTGSAGPT